MQKVTQKYPHVLKKTVGKVENISKIFGEEVDTIKNPFTFLSKNYLQQKTKALNKTKR
jgi:hypothetical protein